MTVDPPDLSKLSRDATAFGSKPAERMTASKAWGKHLPQASVDPDVRWQNSMVGTKSALEDVVRGFEINQHTPEKIAQMLLTSRLLFVHSYFVHEFAFVAAVWSVFGVEAALKDALGLPEGDCSTLTALTGKAQGRGWLTSAEGEQLRYGAKMRNAFVHARAQGSLTVGLAVLVLEASHHLVSVLYERSGTAG